MGVMSWPYYGCTTFICNQRKHPQTVAVAIGRDGVHLFEPGNKDPYISYPYTKISSWAATLTGFTLVSGSLARPDRLALDTRDGNAMKELMQVYVDQATLEKKLAAGGATKLS